MDKPLRSYGENIKVKVNLSNYLKTQVDKLGTNKLKIVPADLSKLTNVVKSEVVKKTEYDKLVNKVNNIDTSGFILKTKYDADKLKLEKKILDTSNLVKNQIIMLKLVKQKVKYRVLVI